MYLSKNNHCKIMIVKITNPYDNEDYLLRQTPNSSGKWEQTIFLMNKKDVISCDYWIILDDLQKAEEVICPKENIILFALEAPSIKTYNNRFLEQFEYVVSCQDSDYIEHKNLIRDITTVFWFTSKTYDELHPMQPFEKDKLLSIITSNKLFTQGHRDRYDFAIRIKNHFKDKVDLYGRGIKDFTEKWDVLAPYKYNICIENTSYPYWITEKLTDCFLSYTYPFYYGSPNVNNYFSDDSYTNIDIYDFKKSIESIEKIIEDDSFYDTHVLAIQEARRIYLEKYNIFPLMHKLVHKLEENKKQNSPILNKIFPMDLVSNNNTQKKYSIFKFFYNFIKNI